MASNECNAAVKHLSGKLSEHFVFKPTADGKVDDGDKVYCVHCRPIRFIIKLTLRVS
jgi:hypothetical protein